MDFRKRTLKVAERSPCIKRRVGAVIVDTDGNELTIGWNMPPAGMRECEDAEGESYDGVHHAEEMAILALGTNKEYANKIYVTHKPCLRCQEQIDALHLETILVDDFMKFDASKTRYDLVPTSAYRGIAEVLTFGARKYKPNNWRKVDDIARYVGAAERHFQDFKEMMEEGNFVDLLDEESKLHILKHVLCDVAFLLELAGNETDALNMYNQSEVYNVNKD